ncbi:MAG: class I SAM-dependent methyltransferase, partial [Candidatus Adiutrix sp.]
MEISHIIQRKCPAKPWVGGEKIPWDDPEFSARMLANHLSQDHDWASRREDIIKQQIRWVNAQLGDKPKNILDLACGPGLYTHHLAKLGHNCVGVDFSPASIDYAQKKAHEAKLTAQYVLSDIRHYQDDTTYDCVMFVFGEFNVFSETDARLILRSCAKLLKPQGLFILEAHTFDAIKETGQTVP